MAEEQPPVERRWCGLGSHKLRTPFRILRNPDLIKFGQRINSELISQPLCLSCYQNLVRLYNFKNNNAKRHLERKRLAALIASESSSISSSKSDGSTDGGPTVAPRDSLSSSEDDGPTTSAAAAAKRARREQQGAASEPSENTSHFSDADDPNSNLSLNAVNGTRLPHIQPIPRRRQFVHLNKEAMDIYLAGTTGG